MFFRKKVNKIEKYEALINSKSFIENFTYEMKEYIGEMKLFINDDLESTLENSDIIPLWTDKMPEKTEKAYNDYVELYQNQMWREVILAGDDLRFLGDELQSTGRTSIHIRLYLTNDVSDFDEYMKKECLGIVVKY